MTLCLAGYKKLASVQCGASYPLESKVNLIYCPPILDVGLHIGDPAIVVSAKFPQKHRKAQNCLHLHESCHLSCKFSCLNLSKIRKACHISTNTAHLTVQMLKLTCSCSISLQIILAILMIACQACDKTTETNDEAASRVDSSDPKMAYFVQVCNQPRATTETNSGSSEARLCIVACPSNFA